MQIEGAKKSIKAEVTEEGLLTVASIQQSMMARANDKGDAYCAVVEADPNGTDKDFFYLKNLDDRHLRIYKIRMSTGTADIDVDIKIGVTGDPGNGTAVVPTNMNAESGKAADVTCEYRDEDLALTGGTVVDTLYIDKDFVGEQEFDYPAEIILPKNTALVFNCVAVDPTADIKFEVFFYFHDPIE